MTQVKLKVKKGDLVRVLSGKDKSKQAKILRVFPSTRKVVLEGLFLVKKHTRPKKAGEKSQLVAVPQAINVSKVMLVCPSCSRPARIGYVLNDNKKERICRHCQNKI